MTLECPHCGSIDVGMAGDNGADYPETRVEFYACGGCGCTFREVLRA